MDVDTSELRALAADFGRVASRALPLVDAAVKKGAQKVKEEMAAEAAGSVHFKAMAGAITYDSAYRVGQVAYEIGPDKDRRAGALGNIAYFGGANGGGGTLDIAGPLRREEPHLLRALGEIPGKIL